VYSVDCLSGPGPEVGRGDGLRWVEPYLAVYSACVAASAHPGVDISIMDYLGKSNELPLFLLHCFGTGFGFGSSVPRSIQNNLSGPNTAFDVIMILNLCFKHKILKFLIFLQKI
jgi:hypothetical protein